MRRALALAAGVAAALMAPAAPAFAQNQIYNDFKKDGQVNPCNYSKGQLQQGLKGLPPDIQQYAPGLADQLRRPCAAPVAPAPPSTPKRQRQVVIPTAAGRPGKPAKPAIPAPPAPRARARRAIRTAAPAVSRAPGGIDLPHWLQLGLLAMGAGVLAVLASVRYLGIDAESLTRPMRASLAEGGDAVAGLRHRLHLGR
jgi:hypothetical protein